MRIIINLKFQTGVTPHKMVESGTTRRWSLTAAWTSLIWPERSWARRCPPTWPSSWTCREKPEFKEWSRRSVFSVSSRFFSHFYRSSFCWKFLRRRTRNLRNINSSFCLRRNTSSCTRWRWRCARSLCRSIFVVFSSAPFSSSSPSNSSSHHTEELGKHWFT